MRKGQNSALFLNFRSMFIFLWRYIRFFSYFRREVPARCAENKNWQETKIVSLFLILGGCGTSRKVTFRYGPRMRKWQERYAFLMLLTIFPSIGGCDRRLYVVCRYGPIGENERQHCTFSARKERRGAPLNGSLKGGASGKSRRAVLTHIRRSRSCSCCDRRC